MDFMFLIMIINVTLNTGINVIFIEIWQYLYNYILRNVERDKLWRGRKQNVEDIEFFVLMWDYLHKMLLL